MFYTFFVPQEQLPYENQAAKLPTILGGFFLVLGKFQVAGMEGGQDSG